MIPRYQAVLFAILLAASIVMGGILWHLRARAHERLLQGEDLAPTTAPQIAPVQVATLMAADDSDDSLRTRELSLPLPSDSAARARAVLGKLLDLYAAPGAAHPVAGGAQSIAQVFLLPEPQPADAADARGKQPAAGPSGREPSAFDQPRSERTASASAPDSQSGPELAVVNLTGAFAASHPSGIETESLTILSICATLHADLPRVAEVRFLVDGQPRATLAGHADLTRAYLTTNEMPAQGANP